MTKLLERAIAQISKLPSNEQDALAAVILEEVASERRWTEAFAKTRDELARLADEALGDFRGGKTEPLDGDQE